MTGAVRRLIQALGLAALFGATPAWAAAAPDGDATERVRITSERRAVESRFDAARRDCEARFTVTDCMATARAQRREALAPLQQQLHMLDDARRRQRAVERLQAIQERESVAAARPALGASAPAAAAPIPSQRRAARPVASSASTAQRQAQDRAAQHGQRLQQAREHEEAVKARNARRDAQRPPAAGLPVPAASAVAP